MPKPNYKGVIWKNEKRMVVAEGGRNDGEDKDEASNCILDPR